MRCDDRCAKIKKATLWYTFSNVTILTHQTHTISVWLHIQFLQQRKTVWLTVQKQVSWNFIMHICVSIVLSVNRNITSENVHWENSDFAVFNICTLLPNDFLQFFIMGKKSDFFFEICRFVNVFYEHIDVTNDGR